MLTMSIPQLHECSCSHLPSLTPQCYFVDFVFARATVRDLSRVVFWGDKGYEYCVLVEEWKLAMLHEGRGKKN